jgi:putative ABC transport system permease protein
VLLSIRNTFRRKGRLLLTLFTLIVGGAIFIAVFNVRASMVQWIGDLSDLFIADVTLNFERPYRISKIEQEALQVPGVVGIEGWSAAGAEIIDADGNVVEDVQILAPPADSPLVNPDLVAGRWIYPGEDNALGVSDGIWGIYPDLVPGDTLPLEVSGERAEEWTVVGVFRFSSMFDSVLGYADYDVISEITGLTNRSFSYRVVTNEHTFERQEAVGSALDRYLRSRGYKVSEAEAGLTTMRDASESINILVVFLMIMALLTALVGSIGLTGTMGMNVLERTREIGVMRAIGAVDLKIINSVIVEGMVIGLISWVFAVLASFPISYLLLKIISEAMIDAPLPLAFTTQGIFIWLGVVMVLAVLASVLPARNAARLTIREVLAYE